MSFQARVVTLDNQEQKRLLKACWDPNLLKLYGGLKKKFVLLRKLPAKELLRLGYETTAIRQNRILEHLRYQTDPRNLAPETLHDLVLLTLTYGPRKGEVIGVNISKGRDGKIEKQGGLRVRHFDAITKRLYIYRTKQKAGTGGKPKVTEIRVTDQIADLLQRHCHKKKAEDFIFSFGDRSPIADIRWPFDEAVDFAGVTVKEMGRDGVGQKLQYRDLRHVAACNLIDAGLRLEEVAYYLGHSSTTMLQQVYYTRRKESQLEQHSGMVMLGMARILGT